MNKRRIRCVRFKKFTSYLIGWDANGYETYYEDDHGYWSKSEFDINGYITYYINSTGNWYKAEYTSWGYQTYYENSKGIIKRPPTCNELEYMSAVSQSNWITNE